MSETYTKLFSSITRSSVWLEDDQTLRVWVTLMALADRNGYVGASVGGLAATARVPVEKTREALETFLAPDPDSRSQEFEGRRLEVADRGWNLLNYERFRDMRDEEARKEYERNRKRETRAKAKLSRDVPDSPDLSAVSAPHKQSQIRSSSEAEAETDPKLIATGPAPKRRTRAKQDPMVVAAGYAPPDPEDRAAVWRAFQVAYRARYGMDLARNATTNAQMVAFLRRVPIADAITTVQHYLRSQNARYVAAGHVVGPLLKDAEKLRTEALTGRQGTLESARKGDHMATLGAEYEAAAARLKVLDDADAEKRRLRSG